MGEDYKLETSIFLKRLEINESRVYDEFPTENEMLMLFSTIAIPTLLVFAMLFFIDRINIIFLVSISIILAVIVMISSLSYLIYTAKKSTKAFRRGVRSVDRMQLSMLFHALDLFSHGCTRDGKIVSPNCPSEYSPITLGGLKEVIKNLSKLVDEGKTSWTKKIGQLLDSEYQEDKVIGLLVLAFGFFGIWIALFMLTLFDLLPMSMYIHLFVIPGFVVFGIILLHAIRTDRKELPEAIHHFIESQEISQEIEQNRDTVLSTINSESKFPLRFLVLGTYPELRYTGNTFETEYGLVLKEAIHIFTDAS